MFHKKWKRAVDLEKLTQEESKMIEEQTRILEKYKPILESAEDENFKQIISEILFRMETLIKLKIDDVPLDDVSIPNVLIGEYASLLDFMWYRSVNNLYL